MNRPRDSQRAKVYAWEGTWVPGVDTSADAQGYLTLEECRKLAEKVAFDYGSWPIPVADGRGRRRAGGFPTGISMPRWSRQTPIVLHEVAHTLTFRHFRWGKVAGHGPEFVRLYIELLVRYMDEAGRVSLCRDARIAGLEVANVEDVPQPIGYPFQGEVKWRD